MASTRFRLTASGVFLGAFALYLFSSAPALAPYRDMGEMVSVAHTLGIAHPPGYPAYALLGKISQLLPVSGASYRLNLVSILGGALACLFFYLTLVRLDAPAAVALPSAGLWAGATGFWSISIVTEMYSLNLCAAMFLIYFWVRNGGSLHPGGVYFLSFLGGLLLGIRLDLVLLAPAFLLLILILLRREKNRGWPAILGLAIAFFALGFSIYLYLLVRSRLQPLLNWNRPETLERLWSSLSRKTHGGTLDLLSTHYAPGELFFTDLAVYLKDAGRQLHWIGLPLAVLGLIDMFRTRRDFFLFTLTGWAFCGPFFIYKANMPPNPHALAVLEAHLNLPNVFLLLWAGLGIVSLFNRFPSRRAFAVLIAAGAAAHLGHGWAKASQRGNYLGFDYARHVLKSVPPGSILVFQKDVQLFSLWAAQYAGRTRPDVALVSRGLAGSPWYIQMQAEAGLPARLGPLRSAQDFERFLDANPGRRVFAGWEEDVPLSSGYRQVPTGLVRELARGAQGDPVSDRSFLLDRIYAYRGNYRADRQKDFFSSDIVEDYAKANLAQGADAARAEGGGQAARHRFDRASALNPENANPYYRRAFLFLESGRAEDSAREFARAESFYEDAYQKSQLYRSLPDVVEGVRREWAECLVNLGVAQERSGRREASQSAYEKALRIDPGFARAHYNLAVLHWNRDWDRAVRHLEATVRIDPGFPQAREFLAKAVYARSRSVPGSRP